jgi:hypothetical protein
MRDNSELYLTGDWLTQWGLTGKPLTINLILGNVIVQIQQENLLSR